VAKERVVIYAALTTSVALAGKYPSGETSLPARRALIHRDMRSNLKQSVRHRQRVVKHSRVVKLRMLKLSSHFNGQGWTWPSTRYSTRTLRANIF